VFPQPPATLAARAGEAYHPRMRTLAALLLAGCAALAPGPGASPGLAPLEAEIRAIVHAAAGDTARVAVALLDLEHGDSLLLDGHVPMHAASTMKVPVMMELFRRAHAGDISMDDPIPVVNAFTSIADGSTYRLFREVDSDPELHDRIGDALSRRVLIERMVARSSDLATNLLIADARPDRIAELMARIGAGGMRVLRGVEDLPAFEAGMNNSTTAHALMRVMTAVGDPEVLGEAAAREMVEILSRQAFTGMIPAGLPLGTRVASKTGNITRVAHDAALVHPPGRAPYVLVVLTRGFVDEHAANEVGRRISAAVWRHVTARGARAGPASRGTDGHDLQERP
jgi:beta-lactamase class A